MNTDTLDRLRQFISMLTRVMIAPATNMKVALPLYATIAVFLLLVLALSILLVLSASDDHRVAPSSAGRRRPREPKNDKPLARRPRVATGFVIVAVMLGVWVLTGFTTSSRGFCVGCHSASQHTKPESGDDPHALTACVSCHESGGTLGRYFTGVPPRLLHLATASRGALGVSDYGRVTVRACTSCHSDSLSVTTRNDERGLKMSHKEPLAASAVCIDCHALRGGIVRAHNAGMAPCLRCHDGKQASSECGACHEGKVTAAARARTTSFRKEQIQDLSCGGCHDEAKNCDPCHGLRMPHTTRFMAGAHSRAAAVDIWFDGGKTCGRCHTASRNSCRRCHTELLGKAHGAWMASGHRGGESTACNTCHLDFAVIATRDFCKDVCHSPEAVAASPR